MKKRIAVDIDEVLYPFVENLIKFYNQRNGTSFTKEQMLSCRFWESFGLSEGEEIPYMLAFFNSSEFRNVLPIQGSREAILSLSQRHSLGIITSRSESVKNETIFWLNNYYLGAFSDVHFAENPFAKNSIWKNGSKRKLEICLDSNYDVLIDDNLYFAKDCAEYVKVLLFGNYPWNKSNNLHSRVKKVENWQEVLEYLK